MCVLFLLPLRSLVPLRPVLTRRTPRSQTCEALLVLPSVQPAVSATRTAFPPRATAPARALALSATASRTALRYAAVRASRRERKRMGFGARRQAGCSTLSQRSGPTWSFRLSCIPPRFSTSLTRAERACAQSRFVQQRALFGCEADVGEGTGLSAAPRPDEAAAAPHARAERAEDAWSCREAASSATDHRSGESVRSSSRRTRGRERSSRTSELFRGTARAQGTRDAKSPDARRLAHSRRARERARGKLEARPGAGPGRLADACCGRRVSSCRCDRHQRAAAAWLPRAWA